MTWSEAGYPSEQTDNPQNKVEWQSDKVYNATDFLSKFEGNQNSIVSSCMQEIQSDTQLKEGFDNLLKSGISNDLINKIKKELEDNSDLDEETLKFLVQGIIAENIENFKIGSMAFEGTLSQMNQEEENAVQEEENAVQNEAEAVQEEENAVQNEAEAVHSGILIDMEQRGLKGDAMIKAIEGRKSLVDKYKNLDSLTNANTQNYKKVEQQLEQNGTLNQLRQNHDEQFVNDYILVQATLLELKSNPTTYEEADISYFDKLVKDLNNACNIPDTSLRSFSSENITQTRTELFHPEVGNESLIQAKNQNMESRDYSEIFPEMGDDEIIAKYGKFLEGGLKEFCQQYQNGPELKTRIENIKGNPSTDEERILLQNYQTMILELKNIKEQTENKTKNLMEELTIISQIKGMYMCIGQENGKDFNLNKANEIQNDNGVLTLKGHIDGVDFSVRHDTTKENAHLQTSSKLGMTPDRNTFMIGSQGQYTDSPFIMPSQEEIFSVITKEVQSDSDDLKKSDNVDSYLENLQQNIMGRMDKVYSEAKYAQHYIRNKVKGEKVVDSSLGLLRKIKPSIDEKLSKPINQANSGKLFDFVKMLNFNIENSTDTEKDKLCKCISKIMEITDNYRANNGAPGFDTVNYPPIIENFLKNQIWLENGNEDARLGLVFDMLSYYNKNTRDTRTNVEGTEGLPSKVFINDLYRDLFEFSGGESEVCKRRTDEKKEQDDKDEAENLLERNPDIWE